MNPIAHRSVSPLVLATFLVCLGLYAQAQVTCVRCFNQNERIYGNVNNLVQNGSFENHTCALNGFFCPASSGYSCDIANWTPSGGGQSTYAMVTDASFSVVVDGINVVYMGSYYCEPCVIPGDTSCMISDGCTMEPLPPGFPSNTPEYGGNGGFSISQTVNGLIPGATYVLEFWSGGEDFNFFVKKGLFGVDVGWGDILLRCNATDPNSSDVGARYAVVFIANSTSHTIKFTNWGHITSSSTELILDDVRLFTTGELPCYDGLGESSANELVSIYPNPFDDAIMFKARTGDRLELLVFDVSGRIVMTDRFSGTTTLSTQHLPTGLYAYEVRGASGSFGRGKLVKQ